MKASRDQLKQYFETGDTPTAAQFSALIDAMLNLQDDGVAGISKEIVPGNERANWLITEQTLNQYLQATLVGAVVAFAMPTAPSGWLACDGRAIDLTLPENARFEPLFARIQTTHGPGNGNGRSFNLPDLRGQFVRGCNATDAGPDPNRVFGSSQRDEMQSHTHHDPGHTHRDLGHSHSIRMYGGYTIPRTWFHPVHTEWQTPANLITSETGHANLEFSKANMTDPVASSAGPARHGPETRPQNVALLYCIKY